MSDQPRPPYVHYYNASAMAFGGRITRPFEEIIETQAPSVLPIGGGFGSSRVDNFRFRDIVCFKAAYSLVTGSQSERTGSFASLASVTIEDLNILDVVTVGKIVSRVSSHHPLPEKEGQPSPEPSIIPLGSKFEDLRVAGCPLDVELDISRFCECDTYQKLRKGDPRLPEYKGMTITSLVGKISSGKPCPGVTIAGDTISLPQFGRIRLAQFLCTSYSRRLVMIGFELGCPVGGSGHGGCATSNGTTVP